MNLALLSEPSPRELQVRAVGSIHTVWMEFIPFVQMMLPTRQRAIGSVHLMFANHSCKFKVARSQRVVTVQPFSGCIENVPGIAITNILISKTFASELHIVVLPSTYPNPCHFPQLRLLFHYSEDTFPEEEKLHRIYYYL